jgi:hypothetical integral membrane protein (TIGR02206 family)
VKVLSPAYVATLAVTAAAAAGLCVNGRHRPGRWVISANAVLAGALLVTSGLWLATTIGASRFSAATSLPFALCDLAALVAAAALLTRRPILVELTYFWGLAGTLQALLTPDLNVGFPRLEFFEYVLAHGAIVCAALFLVVGQGLAPRRWATVRVLGITIAYTAVVGAIDAATGGNYMYLRRPPGNWTLLRALGPWPWYIASAAGVAAVLFSLLDMPFWGSRRRLRASAPPTAPQGDDTRPSTASSVTAGRADARHLTTSHPGRGRPGADGATVTTC